MRDSEVVDFDTVSWVHPENLGKGRRDDLKPGSQSRPEGSASRPEASLARRLSNPRERRQRVAGRVMDATMLILLRLSKQLLPQF
jgi:hypothetical protein